MLADHGDTGGHLVGDDVIDTSIEEHQSHDEQQGGPGGHLPASSLNVELVGKLNVSFTPYLIGVASDLLTHLIIPIAIKAEDTYCVVGSRAGHSELLNFLFPDIKFGQTVIPRIHNPNCPS